MGDILLGLLEEYNDYRGPITLAKITNFLEDDGKLRISFACEDVLLRGLEILVTIISTSRRITAISISNNELSYYTEKLLPAFPFITILALNSTKIGYGGIGYIAEGLRDNLSITDLYLPKNHIGDVDIQNLAKALENNSSITFFDVSGNDFTGIGAQKLCEAMVTMPRLENVYMHGNPLGPSAGASLGLLIENASRLEILDLRGTSLRDEGVKQMAPALSNTKTLTTLDISANQLGEEGVNAVAVAMGTNYSITSLFIARNDIGDAKLEGLTTLLQNNTSLKLIDINWSGIARNTAVTLSNVLHTNQTLTTLDLSQNRLKDADMRELSDALLFTSITSFNLLDNDVENQAAKNYVARPLNINKVCRRLFIGKQVKMLLNAEWLPRSMIKEDEIYNYVIDYQKRVEKRRQIKLIVLGPSGIGKTTLVHYFPHFQKSFWEQAKDRFRKAVLKLVPKPTVGIDELKLQIGGEGKIVVWDCSGKEEYEEWLPFFFSREMAVYLVCYDLSASEETQKAQIGKWIDVLGRAFALPGPRKVILVGLRADMKPKKSTSINPTQWKNAFPSLHEKVFEVSKNKRESMQKLWNEIITESENIMEFVPLVPGFYSTLFKTLGMEKKGIVRQGDFHEHGFGEEWKENITKGLDYLHSVGDLVWINDLVCTKPLILAKKLATKSLTLKDLEEINDLSEGRAN